MQSDRRLVKLFRRGVDPAFDELVNRHRVPLVNFAAAIAGRDRADDVVQEALVKAHRSLSRDQPEEVAAWLYRIVRNTALNDIRDNSKHCHDELGHSAGAAEQPHDVLLRRERLAAVVAAVAELPPSQREAIVGRELGGFTHDEIATRLELSTGATKQLIYRARLTLREALGALIPFPVIALLVGDAAGIYTAGTAGGVAAGAAVSAVSGGAAGGGAGGATGGLLAAVGGSGAAKVAVVAVMAGGSLAAGIAVEHRGAGTPVPPDTAAAAGLPPVGGFDKAEGTLVTAGVATGQDAKLQLGKAAGGRGGGDAGSRGGPGSGDSSGDSGGDDFNDDSGITGSDRAAGGGESGDDRRESGRGGYTDDRREPSRSDGGGGDHAETPSREPREVESSSKPETPEYEPPEKPEPNEVEPPEIEYEGDSPGGSGHDSPNAGT